MKKFYLILAMCMATSAFAQNSFPASNAIWNIRINDDCNNCTHPTYPVPWWENVIYSLEGDTIIDDVVYRKLYHSSYANNVFCGGIREVNQKVWFRMGNDEFLLYDFGASVGDTVWHNLTTSNAFIWYLPSIEPSCSVINSIEIKDGIKYLHTNTIPGYGGSVWIEGMGSPEGLFGHLPMWLCTCFERYVYTLQCFMHNDTVKKMSCECSTCFYCPLYYPLLVSINGYYFDEIDTLYFDNQIEPITIPLYAAHPGYYGYPPFTYLWSTNSEKYIIEDSTIKNPTFSFLGEVTVYLKVTDNCLGACGSIPVYDTLTFKMLPLGENEISNYGISVFPNPAKDIINIKVPEITEIKSINIYSMDGKLVRKSKYFFFTEQIDISKLEIGTYIIKIETDKGSFNKIIIKN